MRYPLVSIFLVIVVTSFMGGCSKHEKSPLNTADKQISTESLDQLLPEYPSVYWDVELKNVVASLQPNEKVLLEEFMSRHIKKSTTDKQIPIPNGTTLRQAIFVQEAVDALMAEQEAEMASLKDTVQKQDSEILALKTESLRCEVAAANQVSKTTDQSLNVPPGNINTSEQAKQNAYISYGVPELERQLEFSMNKDRKDPYWEQFQVDSTGTAAIRVRLMAARHAAEQSIQLTSGR